MTSNGHAPKKQFIFVFGLNGLICLVVWFYISTYPGLIRNIYEWKAVNPTNSSITSNMYRDRQTLLYKNCETLHADTVSGRRPVFFFAKSKSLAFCKVPKAGSTFVGTVVAALELHKEPGNLFHRSREVVHGQNEVDFFKLSKYSSGDLKTILVTRDPYTRLFSAFIDKYFILGARSKTIAKKKGKGRFKMGDGFCGYNISFQEFLEHFTDLHNAGNDVEEHTMPVSSLCHPCTIHYNIICRQETLTSDIEYILDIANVSESKRQTVMNMIHSESLNDTIYALIASHILYYNLYPDDCSSKILFMEKLWKVFQFQGYINLSLTFPRRRFEELKNFGEENVTSLILEQIKSSPLSRLQMRKQKHRLLAEAYSTINSTTIARVQRMFGQDFHLFGYDKTIPT